MKTHLRNQLAALFLLLPTSACLIALPAAAATRRAAAQAPAPETHGLEVNADAGLNAGSQLQLTLEGTPRGRASARILGTNINIALKETSQGVYTGQYTVRRSDRINPAEAIRVSLTSGKRTVSSNYAFPPSFAPQPAAAPAAPVAAPAVLKIDRFVVAPVSKVEPGAELRFRLDGMPGASASFDIPGVAGNVPMREVTPGHYEGRYTIRRQDNVQPSAPVKATLRSGNSVVTASLSQPLIADNNPPVIGNLTPRQGESVAAGVTLVSGTFEDAGGSRVDPKSVRILLSGRDVTGDARITPQLFTYRAELPPGRHTVDVTAKDLGGNATHQSWSFDVGPGAAAPAAAGLVLPLQVTSHRDNAQIDSSVAQIRGRTAPGATVTIRVDAVPPLIGQRLGVAQQLVSETLQADANGDFSFTFNPRGMPFPGSRYEVTIQARRADQSAESKLVLYQRG